MSTIPQATFAHIGLYTRDLERMERFYTRYLGLTVTDRGELGGARLVFLSRDPNEHHQIVLVSGRADANGPSPLNQISLRVPDLAALRHFQAHADEHGGNDVQSVTHGNAISLYVRDPEGNRIEFYIDTPWYVTQPLRVAVDLSKPDDAVWKDVEKLARSLPGFSPAAEWRDRIASRMNAG